MNLQKQDGENNIQAGRDVNIIVQTDLKKLNVVNVDNYMDIISNSNEYDWLFSDLQSGRPYTLFYYRPDNRLKIKCLIDFDNCIYIDKDFDLHNYSKINDRFRFEIVNSLYRKPNYYYNGNLEVLLDNEILYTDDFVSISGGGGYDILLTAIFNKGSFYQKLNSIINKDSDWFLIEKEKLGTIKI